MIEKEISKRLHISVFEDKKDAQRLWLVLASRREYGRWLGSDFIWHHLVVLTFAHEANLDRARREFGDWVRSLERRGQRAVGWFFVAERGAAGRLHLHALLVGTQHLHVTELERSWRPGRATVSVYDPQQAGSYYLAKGIGLKADDWDIAPASKLRRRDGEVPPRS
jgi:hypothetical protein